MEAPPIKEIVYKDSDLVTFSVTSNAKFSENLEDIEEFLEMEKRSIQESDSRLSITSPAEAMQRFRKSDSLSQRLHMEFQMKTEKAFGDSLFKEDTSQSANENSPDEKGRTQRSQNRSRLGSVKSIRSVDKRELEPIEESDSADRQKRRTIREGGKYSIKSNEKQKSPKPNINIYQKRTSSHEWNSRTEKMIQQGIGSPKLGIGKYDPTSFQNHREVISEAQEKGKILTEPNLVELPDQNILETSSLMLDKCKDTFQEVTNPRPKTNTIRLSCGIPEKNSNNEEISPKLPELSNLIAPVKKLAESKVYNPCTIQRRKPIQKNIQGAKLISISPPRQYLKKGDGQKHLHKTSGSKTIGNLDKSAVGNSHKTIPINNDKICLNNLNGNLMMPVSVAKKKQTFANKEQQHMQVSQLVQTLAPQVEKLRKTNQRLAEAPLSEVERKPRRVESKLLDESGLNILKKASCKLLPNIEAKDIINDSFKDILLSEEVCGRKSSVRRLASSDRLTIEDVIAQTSVIIKEHFNQRKEKVRPRLPRLSLN